jgi:hypothetical protein
MVQKEPITKFQLCVEDYANQLYIGLLVHAKEIYAGKKLRGALRAVFIESCFARVLYFK